MCRAKRTISAIILLLAFFCTGLSLTAFADSDNVVSITTSDTNTESSTDTDKSDSDSVAVNLPAVTSDELDIPKAIGEYIELQSSHKTWAIITAWVMIIIAVVLIISVIMSISGTREQKKEAFQRKTYSRARLKYKRHKIANRYNMKK